MRRKYLLLVFLLFPGILFSKPVPVEDAEQIAYMFYKHQSINGAECVIQDIVCEKAGTTITYYAFNFVSGGFVIVAADNAVSPILGYSADGTYNQENIPENAKWLYDEYKSYIKAVIDLNIDNPDTKKEWDNLRAGRFPKSAKAVAPLCATQWGQGCYFNEFCPADINGQCGHTVTGCVATSMAQIMKRWNYPQHGTGAHSYELTNYGTQSADFGSTTYQWGSMPNTVSTNNSAVATLMYHCGVSLEMNYGTSGSNASILMMPLIQYFSYSQNMSDFSLRLNDSATKTKTLIKEIDAGRPMWIGGSNSSSVSHAYVCDGYDDNYFFHFNFGWGGSSDGYYNVNLGTSMPYGLNMFAVIGIMPLVPNDIAIKNLIAPSSAESFTGPRSISITIANYDTIPHTGIPVSYVIDNGSVVNDTVTDTIPALSEIIFEFSQPYDFSTIPGHLYTLKAYSRFAIDSFRENDTLISHIENAECITPPYYMNFRTTDDFQRWRVTDLNQDGNTWVEYLEHPQGNLDPGYIKYYYNSSLAANDWLISRCLNLEASKTYTLSFWHKVFAGNYPNKMKVSIGKLPITDSLTTTLVDLTNITNEEYQIETVDFTVPSDGSYYIGWQCYSDSDMIFLYLDNISITEAGSSKIGNNTLSTFDGCQTYPNPTDGKLSIKFSTKHKSTTVVLFSILGQELQCETFQNTQIIQLEINQPDGIYILEISDDTGNKTVMKIVKE